jgi:hypothetical protein
MTLLMKNLLLGSILMAFSVSVPAALYKWVDENGTMQYSQEPPPSGSYQEIQAPTTPPSSEQEPSPANSNSGPAADPATATPASKQDLAKQEAARELNCQLAQERLSQLENHARIRYKSADGSMRIMSEEEKQAKLLETRKMADETCN